MSCFRLAWQSLRPTLSPQAWRGLQRPSLRGFGVFLVIYGAAISFGAGVEQQKASSVFCLLSSRQERQEFTFVPVWTRGVRVGMWWEQLRGLDAVCSGDMLKVTSLKHLLKSPWFKSRAEEPDFQAGVASGWGQGLLWYPEHKRRKIAQQR